jgi:uncharacterized membrane protein
MSEQASQAPLRPRTQAVLYVLTLAAFLVIDGVWLALMGPHFYRPELGALMAAEPRLAPAVLFYALFVAALLVLVVVPGRSQSRTRFGARAALFGLVTYGTYDLTNLAVLSGWSTLVTVVDMVWGALLSTMVAFAGRTILRRLDGAK